MTSGVCDERNTTEVKILESNTEDSLSSDPLATMSVVWIDYPSGVLRRRTTGTGNGGRDGPRNRSLRIPALSDRRDDVRTEKGCTDDLGCRCDSWTFAPRVLEKPGYFTFV